MTPWLAAASVRAAFIPSAWFALACVGEACDWVPFGIVVDGGLGKSLAVMELCSGEALALLALSLCADCCDVARGEMRPF